MRSSMRSISRMHLQFTVSNSQAFRDLQTLNQAASTCDRTLSENCITRDLPGPTGQRPARGMAIYGPNASGKAAKPSSKTCARPGDAFLIVTEDAVTDLVYFELLRKSVELSTVTVKIHSGSASYPTHGIDPAAKAHFRKTQL